MDTSKQAAVAAITVILTVLGLMLYYGDGLSDEKPEEEKFIVTAFQNGNWSIPQNYSLYADEKEIGRTPSLLEHHKNNWTSFPGELRSDQGPWVYECTLWYNTATNETHIQKH